MSHSSILPLRSARRQQGAALYVAMIMIILLAMIGIVGMQVAGLQERMASNYLNVNLAFQNAEAEVRQVECYLKDNSACTAVASRVQASLNSNPFDESFDPTAWAAAKSVDVPQADRLYVRDITDRISGNASLDMGTRPESEKIKVFQITVYATNDAATANAAVDTIFRP